MRFVSQFAGLFAYFWTPGLPEGVHVITHVRPSVGPSVFKYLRDRSLVFSNFGLRMYLLGSLVITLVVHVSIRMCVPSVRL